jgi:large subunit ribosomal protein L9
MKIILLQDVARIGRRFSIVEVPDGFAQNQLIPKKLAQAATPENLKRVNKLHADSAASDAASMQKFNDIVTALRASHLTVAAEANEQAHLFKAVSEKEIVAAAAKRGIVLTTKHIHLSAPIKSLGEHEIVLKHGQSEVTVTIEVIKN